jgi:hypothetical protein
VQHPIGHEFTSHWQTPVLRLHSWPAGHAAHVAPPLPHEVFDSLTNASHMPAPAQQPAHEPPPQEH